MKTRIETEKILITKTYYSDRSESSLAEPITWVETKVFVDDELYYSDVIDGQLYYNTASKVTDFLDWLFCTKSNHAKTVNNVGGDNSKESSEKLKKLLAPIIREVVDEIRPKIDLEQFFDHLIIQIKEDLKKTELSRKITNNH